MNSALIAPPSEPTLPPAIGRFTRREHALVPPLTIASASATPVRAEPSCTRRPCSLARRVRDTAITWALGTGVLACTAMAAQASHVG